VVPPLRSHEIFAVVLKGSSFWVMLTKPFVSKKIDAKPEGFNPKGLSIGFRCKRGGKTQPLF
jgi:hypothetical protein